MTIAADVDDDNNDAVNLLASDIDILKCMWQTYICICWDRYLCVCVYTCLYINKYC